MTDFTLMYREFINYKLTNVKTYIDFIKKIRSFTDVKYSLGLIKFCLKNLVFKPTINNETVRGR